MNSLLLAIIAVALAVLVWLVWQKAYSSEVEAPPADERISPLLRGINFLLADQPDRALSELVQVAKLHTETAEIYLALGGLFRGKGEVGRAVRIHQNLLARPDLPQWLHVQAHLALGQDFQAGGFLGRALKQYAKVLQRHPDHEAALKACLRIHEQGHDWREAEEVLLRLDQVKGQTSSLHRAYLVTEMAREALARGDKKTAIAEAEQAMALDANCASAHLLFIELQLKSRSEKGALEGMRRLKETAPQHLPLLAPLLLAHPAEYRRYGEAFLLDCWQDHRDEELALAWLEGMHAAHGKRGLDKLLPTLDFKPQSLRANLRLMALDEDGGDLAHLAREWRSTAHNYRCAHCGVEVVEMRWQCPQCYQWGSMHPIAGELT